MATNKDVIKSFTIKVNTKDGKVKIDGVTKSFKEAGAAFDTLQGKMDKGLPNVSKQMDGITASSGGAAASVTELGRVLSDAPYGIRGVANNLSQLSANLALTARKAGGFGGAMKSLGQAFMGPLGILVGIQAGLALLEAWSMRAKEAALDTGLLVDGVGKAGSNLKILRENIELGLISTDNLAVAVKAANGEYEDLNLQIGENGKLTEASIEAMDRKIKTLERLARATAIQKLVEENLEKSIRLEVNTRRLNEQAIFAEERAMRVLQSTQKAGVEGILASAEGARKAVKENNAAINALAEDRKKLLALIGEEELEDELFTGPTDKGNKKRVRALKVFKQQLLDLEKVVLNNRKQQALDSERYELDIIKVQGQYAQDEIDLRVDTFKEKQKLRLDDYLESIKGHKKEGEMREAAIRKYNESIEIATTEGEEAKLSIRENYANKWALKSEEIAARQRTDVNTNSLDIVNDAGRMADPFAAEANDPLREARRDAYRRDMEERLSMERVGTDAYYEILKERLEFTKRVNDEEYQSEVAKINKKKQINMEYASFLSSTASILRNIAGENEAIQKLALVAEKGAAVAKVVIGAQASISGRQAAHAAIPSFINIPAPTGIISIPNPAKAADKLAMLKANLTTKVGAGLSIANILSQTIKKTGSVKGGGAKAEGGGREFDFNLVGSTGQNQLAQATAGQLNQPVQAFVVSSEITSQQQLDNTIQTNASFGD